MNWTKRFRPVELAEQPTQELPAVPPTLQDDELIATLASQLGARVAVNTVASVLGAGVDIAEAAIRALLELDGIRALIRVGGSPALAPDPVRAQHRQNLIRRATYLVNAARRLTTAVVGPAPVSRAERLQAALIREKAFLHQHVAATTNRNQAAQEVARQYVAENMRRNTQAGLEITPTLLGWYAKMDERTSHECRNANGRNFDPLRIPSIGYPGAVHPHCRCKPGPPHQTELLVDGGPFPQVTPEVAMSNGYVAGRHRRPDLATVDLVASASYPSLERKPGKQNWVDKAGGLPDYIERIAKHLHYEQGMDISRAIASAVNTVKRWAAGGDNVKPETQAKAARAVAQWEAKKAASRG